MATTPLSEDATLAYVTNATVYVRISDDRAGERAGVTRQREDCEQRALDRGWTIHAHREDNDITAKGTKHRPGFEGVLEDITSGAVQVVLAWSLDRVQRNKRDELRLYEACQKHGVVLALVNGADLDFSTAAGRFVAESLGSVARMEIDLKSDRQRRQQEQAAANGVRSGGRKPFGYEPDGMTIRESEAALLRKAYRDYLAGTPMARIAQQWNDAGMFSGQTRWSKGHEGEPARWRGATVREVLRNPRYAGLRAHKGEVVAKAAWPAVVDEDTWRATVARLAQYQAAPKKLTRRLLSGLALCGLCDAPVWGGGNARKGFPGYRCSATMGHFARMSEPVDEYVAAVIVERLSRLDAVDLIRRPATIDTAALRDEERVVRARLDEVATEFADGSLTPGQLRTITARLRDRLAAIDTELADASRVSVLGDLVGAEDVQAAWNALDQERQRAVIDVLCVVRLDPPGRGTRTFRPESVRIEWRGRE